MKKRKRYTIRELIELEKRWVSRLLRAANRVGEIRKRMERMERAQLTPVKARTFEVDPLSVDCLTCHVGKGARCLRGGELVEPHRARVRRAAEAKAKS